MCVCINVLVQLLGKMSENSVSFLPALSPASAASCSSAAMHSHRGTENSVPWYKKYAKFAIQICI